MVNIAKTIFIVLVMLAMQSEGSTIYLSSLANDVFLDSNGSALDGAYTFEWGTFEVGFTPDSENLDQWASNWKVFDAAIAGNGWNPAGTEVYQQADHASTGASTSGFSNPLHTFGEGDAAYLWVYSTKDIYTSPEWALLADLNKTSNLFPDSWVIPDPALQNGESFDWHTRDLDTAVWGGVNNVQGSGEYTVAPASFTIQTHVVPEPGSALLLLAAGLLFRLRRGSASSRS